MYIIRHLHQKVCITRCMCPQLLLLIEDGCSSWPKHVGASKLCIVQLVGNDFVI
jgi:hypothetical protein